MSRVDVVQASDHDALARATAALDGGELLLVPGDLRYLVVADALHDDAVERLFLATRRPADRPLTVLVGGYEDIQHVAYGTPLARQLAETHWPGPTALVLKARPWIPDAITAGGETVAVASPRDAFTQKLARHFGPLACASARHEGSPDARTAQDAQRAIHDARLVVDAGARQGGRGSVLDATGPEAKLIRAGSAPAP